MFLIFSVKRVFALNSAFPSQTGNDEMFWLATSQSIYKSKIFNISNLSVKTKLGVVAWMLSEPSVLLWDLITNWMTDVTLSFSFITVIGTAWHLINITACVFRREGASSRGKLWSVNWIITCLPFGWVEGSFHQGSSSLCSIDVGVNLEHSLRDFAPWRSRECMFFPEITILLMQPLASPVTLLSCSE